MSTKAQLIARIAELETANAALEAKLVVARTCYKQLRDSVYNVEAPALVAAATKSVAPTPVVKRYRDRLGREWIKTIIGNRASSRLAA